MSCYASQINRLDILIRRKHQAGAIPGDSTPAEPAKAIAGILEAYDLIIRQLGQWPDHLIWPPGPVVALHAARRRLQDTLCSVARRHPASNPCTRPDQIAAALDEMCADRQRMATCPPTAHSHPGSPERLFARSRALVRDREEQVSRRSHANRCSGQPP
jgi:hypothetical protein